jgi:hypothetical protein
MSIPIPRNSIEHPVFGGGPKPRLQCVVVDRPTPDIETRNALTRKSMLERGRRQSPATKFTREKNLYNQECSHERFLVKVNLLSCKRGSSLRSSTSDSACVFGPGRDGVKQSKTNKGCPGRGSIAPGENPHRDGASGGIVLSEGRSTLYTQVDGRSIRQAECSGESLRRCGPGRGVPGRAWVLGVIGK